MQRELSPQATEGLFLSCEFCNPSASRCSAPPFTQGRRKVVVVAFATAVQICKCQTFSEGFQPCQHHALIGLSKPPALPVVMTAFRPFSQLLCAFLPEIIDFFRDLRYNISVQNIFCKNKKFTSCKISFSHPMVAESSMHSW